MRILSLTTRSVVLAGVCSLAFPSCGILDEEPIELATYPWSDEWQCEPSLAIIDGEPWRVRITGDRDTAPHVWGVDRDGRQVLLTWPEGTSVSFAPGLALGDGNMDRSDFTLSYRGQVYLHENDEISSERALFGCGPRFAFPGPTSRPAPEVTIAP